MKVDIAKAHWDDLFQTNLFQFRVCQGEGRTRWGTIKYSRNKILKNEIKCNLHPY